MIGMCLYHLIANLLYFLLWSEYLCPPTHFYVEILMPDVMVPVSEALGDD